MKTKRDRQSKDGKAYKFVKGKYVYARLQFTDANGKRQEKLRPAADKKEAKQIKHQMQQELLTGGAEVLLNDRATFQQLGELFKKKKFFPAILDAKGLKIAGYRSYDCTLKYIYATLVAYFGKRLVRSIKKSDIEVFKLHRYKTALNKKKTITGGKKTSQREMSSVNKEMGLLKTMFTFAVSEKLLLQNQHPMKENDPTLINTKSDKKREPRLSEAGEIAMLAQCVGRRKHLRAIVITALDSAMRRGEILGLTLGMVDLKTRIFNLPAFLTKTQEGRRVFISDRLAEELAVVIARLPSHPDQLVFGGIKSVQNAYENVKANAGIVDFTFHDLRHIAITRWIRSGMETAEAMNMSGHTEMKTFMRYLTPENEAFQHSAKMLKAHLTGGVELATENEALKSQLAELTAKLEQAEQGSVRNKRIDAFLDQQEKAQASSA